MSFWNISSIREMTSSGLDASGDETRCRIGISVHLICGAIAIKGAHNLGSGVVERSVTGADGVDEVETLPLQETS